MASDKLHAGPHADDPPETWRWLSPPALAFIRSRSWRPLAWIFHGFIALVAAALLAGFLIHAGGRPLYEIVAGKFLGYPLGGP